MLVNISCPACEVGQIAIQPNMLIEGQSFGCNHCDASVGVADNSKASLANGLHEFDNLKTKVASMKAEGAKLN
jgi:hypothetical protein